MGNSFKGMSSVNDETSLSSESGQTFPFHGDFPEDSNNGLYLKQMYVPQEIITMILSQVEPKQLLKCSEVCKKWCNIIKSDSFWANLYTEKYKKKAKKLPWYVYYCLLTTDYFDNNLLKNGNGQDGFKHWQIMKNYGDEFRIEDPPTGSDPLPLDVPEFNKKTSCFATSYYECNKFQEISFIKSNLMRVIFDKHKPHIYASEWVAGRFDCGCVYDMWCKLYPKDVEKKKKSPRRRRSSSSADSYSDSSEDSEAEPLSSEHTSLRIEQWAGATWAKVEVLLKDYPSGVARIIFQHEGRDTQFWKGHYGSKMAGGVVKIVFDSIDA